MSLAVAALVNQSVPWQAQCALLVIVHALRRHPILVSDHARCEQDDRCQGIDAVTQRSARIQCVNQQPLVLANANAHRQAIQTRSNVTRAL